MDQMPLQMETDRILTLPTKTYFFCLDHYILFYSQFCQLEHFNSLVNVALK